MQPPQRYPSDLSDAQWELIRPTLETWRAARAGIRQRTHDLRDLMDAILYVDRTGIPWRYLPHDFPPWQSVYGYFATWQKDGVFDRPTGLLPRLARETEGRSAEPTVCLLDSQTVKTSATVHLADQGLDAAKKIAGRKRHLATDTLGLLLTVLVTAGGVHDSTGSGHLLDHLATHHRTITKAWADAGYKNTVIEHAATRGIDLEVVHRTTHSRTFTSSPAAGSSNAPWAGSCTTAAWPATTKPCPPAPKSS